MLSTILSVLSLVLVAVDFVLIWQLFSCLKKCRENSAELPAKYLIRRLNAVLVNGFLVAALRIVLILL